MDVCHNIESLHQACLHGVEYAAEVGKKAFDRDNFCRIWIRLIDSGSGIIFALKQGSIGCGFCPNMLTGELEGHISYWFVSPKYRNQGYGKKLLDMVEKEARDRGCKAILHGHPGIPRPGMQKLGFEIIETGYRKKL